MGPEGWFGKVHHFAGVGLRTNYALNDTIEYSSSSQKSRPSEYEEGTQTYRTIILHTLVRMLIYFLMLVKNGKHRLKQN